MIVNKRTRKYGSGRPVADVQLVIGINTRDKVGGRVMERICARIGVNLQNSGGTVAILGRKITAEKLDGLNTLNPNARGEIAVNRVADAKSFEQIASLRFRSALKVQPPGRVLYRAGYQTQGVAQIVRRREGNIVDVRAAESIGRPGPIHIHGRWRATHVERLKNLSQRRHREKHFLLETSLRQPIVFDFIKPLF